jgi:hypothetical protein
MFFTGSEADRENEFQIGVGDLGRRRWKRRGTSQQGERLGVEHGGSGSFLNPAGHDVALPIDGEGETDHPLGRIRLRGVSVVARQTCQQRLVPLGDCRRTGWRRALFVEGPSGGFGFAVSVCATRDTVEGSDCRSESEPGSIQPANATAPKIRGSKLL